MMRKCKRCGEDFDAGDTKRTTCDECARVVKIGKPPVAALKNDLRKDRQRRREEHRAMLERLRERDRAYAAEFGDKGRTVVCFHEDHMRQLQSEMCARFR